MSSFSTFVISIVFNLHRYVFSDIITEERLCLRIAENDIYQPEFKPSPNQCIGWFCWQSQLTLFNKASIATAINEFREQNADLILNMNKLVWHWALEQEAIRASSTCLRTDLETYYLRRNIEGLGYSLKCENGCMYKPLNLNPSQAVFVNLLPELLKNNTLQDFDEFNKFRRGNAEFVGCSLVVRTTITKAGIFEDVFNFVCVFCTTADRFMTKFQTLPKFTPECPRHTTYGGDTDYPNLCQQNHFKNIFMCEPLHACPHEGSKPSFSAEQPGQVAELILLETTSGPILMVNRSQSIYDSNQQSYNITFNPFIDIDGQYVHALDVFPAFSKGVYKYSSSDLQFYKQIVNKLNPYINITNPAVNETRVVVVPGQALYGTNEAWCCLIIFFFSFTCIIVLFALSFYTFKEIRHRHKRTKSH